MAELKTKPNDGNVSDFIASIKEEKKQADSKVILNLMQETTGEKPVMWGNSIIGFGQYHYCYESGREGDWFLTGFSPRKQAITLYIMSGFNEYKSLLEKLGKYKTGKACLYINKIEDVDIEVLRKLITMSVQYLKKQSKGE